MALHDSASGPLEIYVQSFFQAQGAHEPVSQLEQEVEVAMEGHELDGMLRACIAVHTALDPLPLPRRLAPPQSPAHLMRSLFIVTERLHALFCAWPSPTAGMELAIVLGTSLSFPRWTALVRLEGSWDASDNGVDDTNECMGRRRKAAALLERKVTRCLLEAMPVVTDEVAPTQLRVLVRAPASLRVSGWRPRPHWHAPQPVAPPSQALASSPNDAEEAPAPARPSRMGAHVQGLLQGQRVVRPSLTLRTRPQMPVMLITVQGTDKATEAAPHDGGLCSARDVWLECDTVVVGLGRGPASF
ncbi:hypothetical protein MNAN1_002026 [Malassezia nana]|uniref:Uncharacterized protein n=1 Tax=Malassezia nana TaxID=180528 RepID=A0AAF0ERR4_9BASI|nr:hypothetical protein MNAN1_002026 [Malassezia nana]